MRLLISGYYGFGNLGDEAILGSLVQGFKAYDSKLQLTVLSANPQQTKADYHLPAINRNSLPAIIKAMWQTDVFISGGGGLLQDKTSSRSFFYYLGLIKLARLLRKKVYVFAQGIGPIKNRRNNWLLKRILDQVDLITVRDNKSFAYLNSLKLKKPKIVNTADPTFILEPDDGKDLLKIAGINKGSKKLIGLSLRDLAGQPFPSNELASLADALIEQLDANVVFIPCQPQEDMAVINQVTQKMKHGFNVISRRYQSRELLGIITQMDLVVAMRLHCLIFSLLANVPAIGLAYDPKVSAFMEEVSLPWLDIKKVKAEEIMLMAKELLDHSPGVKQSLAFNLRRLQAKARLNFGLIELLKA